MKKTPDIYLQDILDAIRRIETSTSGKTKSMFESDADLQDATIRRLEVIGEAAKGIPPAMREKCPEVPWKSIAGTRDVLIHDHSGVVLETIWEVVQNDLPKLKAGVQKLLTEIEAEKRKETGKQDGPK